MTYENINGDTSASADSTDETFAPERALVMMVDDETINIEMTQAFLEEAGYRRFCSTTDATRAIDLLRSSRPQVLLLDIHMPQVNGFEILAAMRADRGLRHVPTIVLTSAIDSATKLRALELGANDFLGKPVDPSELVLRLRNTLAARAYQEFLERHDRLTGLPNRQHCMEQVERALGDAALRGHAGAVLQIDVDRFKQFNEALGPAVGDELLKQVAQRLARCVAEFRDAVPVPGPGDEFMRQMARRLAGGSAADTGSPAVAPAGTASLSRFDGDEFTVLLPRVVNAERVVQFAARVREACAAPYPIAGHELYVTMSVGIAMFPDDGRDVDSVVKHAGIAMHHAKQGGRDTCRFYAPELNARALQHLSVESELRRALTRDELVMYYQPKIETASGRLVGAEALVRWNHPQRGFLAPGHFVPIAESTGLIVPMGEWVLDAVCRQAERWQAAGLDPTTLSFNASAQQFAQPQFIQTVHRIIGRSALARHLCMELTETSMMANPQASLQALRELKEMGLKLSIDDFGTGYSSLSYLQRFPIDELKIDKSFVDGVLDDVDSAAIVVAIIAMAKSLGLSLVAEGVETAEQLAFLRDRGCDQCQGYLFSKPVPADEFARLWLKGAQATIASQERRVAACA